MADEKVSIEFGGDTKSLQKSLTAVSKEFKEQLKIVDKVQKKLDSLTAKKYEETIGKMTDTKSESEISARKQELSAQITARKQELDAYIKEYKAFQEKTPTYGRLYDFSQRPGVNKGLVAATGKQLGINMSDYEKYVSVVQQMDAKLKRLNTRFEDSKTALDGFNYSIEIGKTLYDAYDNSEIEKTAASLATEKNQLDAIVEKRQQIEEALRSTTLQENKMVDSVRAEQLEAAKIAARKEHGSDSQEYKEAKKAVEDYYDSVRRTTIETSTLSRTSAASIDNISKRLSKIKQKLTDIPIRALSKMLNSMIAPLKKLQKHAISFGKRMKTAVLQGLVFRQVRTVLANLVQSMAEMVKTNKDVVSAFAELKGTSITAFEPIVTALIPAIIQFISWVQQAIIVLAKFLALLGKIGGFSKKSAKAMYDQAKATKAAGGAADLFLASWDTIQKVTSSGGGGGGEIAPDFGFDDSMPSWADELAGAVEEDRWFIVGQLIEEQLNNIKTQLNNWLQGEFRAWLVKFGKSFADLLNGMMFQSLSNPDNVSIGKMVANFFNGIIAGFTEFVSTFSWNWLGQVIAQSINDFFSTFDFTTAAKGLSKFGIGILTTIIRIIENTDWSQITRSIITFVSAIDWSGVVSTIFEGIGAAFGALAQILGELLSEGYNKAVEVCWDLFVQNGEFTIKGFLEGIVNALKSIGTWIVDNIFNPFVDGFMAAFGIHSPSTEMKPLGENIVAGMLEGIKNKLSNIKAWIKEHVFDPVMNGIKSAFGISSDESSEMKSAGNALSSGLASGIEGGISKIKSVINSIIDIVEEAINWMIGKINVISFTAPNWVPFIGGKSFGFNLPKVSIPRLAQGGVVNPGHEFAAILGDNRREQEIVSPISTMKQAFMEALSESGMGARDIRLYLDGKEIAKIVLST